MKKVAVANWDALEDRVPSHALVANVDLVITRVDDSVSVLYGRCAHRGALMSDGHVDGDNLICGLHGWDYRIDTGISEYNHSETLSKFNAGLQKARCSSMRTKLLPGGRLTRNPTIAMRTKVLIRIPRARSMSRM